MPHAAPAPYPTDLGPVGIDPPVPHPMLSEPAFERLHRMRRRFSWTLTAAMLAVYFGFILTLAFRPDLLALPLTPGQPMSIGIPVGFGMFAFTFALVAIYVHRSNTVYDRMIADICKGIQP
ncbi:DUF485 domain-containing protein [Cupriavidus sp. L7L]|uniref:DUF485 domain-containing protein n=1 Tax=Cupriavidus sp. L7L TaxID=2546443 RepID=UPI0010565780|nr:DUF485 domain-containing protein [Cupriavidus sp. L7L]TDF60128.1 DUF485 domain-containing protein [Cupriavidus sp. L7L]